MDIAQKLLWFLVVLSVLVVAGSSYFFAHGNEQLAQLLSRPAAART